MPVVPLSSVSTDGVPSPEQLIALLGLCVSKSQFDLTVVIEKDGSPIAGDSPRNFADGKPHLEIEGYLWGVSQRSGSGTAGHQPYTLYVVRRCDVATASVLSALTSASEKVRVTLGAYRAGGDSDGEPVLEITIDKARMIMHTFLTGPGLNGPCEILGFAGKKFEVKSAPQQATGIRGAVRTCEFEVKT